MNRDQLYRKIVDALARPLDGDTFQRCAVALLGRAHPNLAPLHGGDDAGIDGAFGAPDGPSPLVCTTQSNVIGNFRDNISTYLAKRNGPKLAVVATSQHLSNAKKRNLEGEARRLGVTITNIYDALYFANELYRDSKWRLELLGITGDPPALSALPRAGRFVQPEILVGRDEDLEWLRQVQGDVLLVGQPGAGKTYLHQYLANQGFCLFAVDDSLQRLADAIREQQPSIIVVDDAHINLKLVEDLKRLRAELGAVYHIHLNCWPRQEAAVQRVLNIPDYRVRRLRLLPRPAIFEMIKQMGISGPDWLQHLLISQSDGKPGLAVALAELCKTEDVAHIWSGEATARQLLGDLRLVRDENERCVLAAFAVGGDAGMSFSQVSEALGLSKLELRQITAGLGSGGLVEEIAEDRLQVRPPAIRAVLVRDVFYGGPTSLRIDRLLEGTCSIRSTAVVLLSARQRGAKIDHSLLERFVTAADTDDIWEHFGWVDGHCAATILDKYPEHVCHAAPGLLNYSPNRAVHALLDAADADLVRQPGAVEHPRRRIGEWLFPFDEAPDVTMERRLALLNVLEERVRQKRIGNGTSFAWASAEVLQLTFDITRPSPGNSFEINCVRGVASHAILDKIAPLWPRVKELFRHVPNATARIFFDRLENWFLPQRLSLVSQLTAETYELVRAKGRQMLSDMLEMPQCNRAWRTRAAHLAKWGNLDLQIQVDQTFDSLYADRDSPENWEAEQKKRTSELQAWADELIQRPIDDGLQFLSDIRSEALEFGYRDATYYLRVVYHHIAKYCESPTEWLDALIARRAPSESLIPFVDRLSVEDSGQHEAALKRLLECADYHALAISRVIRLPTPNEALLSTALALLTEPDLAEHLWLRDSGIPLTVMAKLLEHPKKSVRAAAAIGEWQRDPAGTVRPELEGQWRIAIREVDPNHYALREVFERNPCSAFEWLQSQIRSGNARYLSTDDQALQAASKVLDKGQRDQLLRLFTRKNYSDNCFDVVMGEHTELFAGWLKYQTDEAVRLRPLERDVSPRWEQMAVLALEAGVCSEDLADHCTPNEWGGVGPISQWFIKRIPMYEALANHRDPRLRPAGKRGLNCIQGHAKRELERENREERHYG
jgi:hypothetical protein